MFMIYAKTIDVDDDSDFAEHSAWNYSKENMDLFDTQFFIVNKKFSEIGGVWPFDESRTKYLRRSLVVVALLAVYIPHLIAIYQNYPKDVDRVLEQLTYVVYATLLALKFLSSIYYEDKLKTLYTAITKNWTVIDRKDERKILTEHSQMGGFLSMGYTLYMAVSMFSFIMFPLIPIILNVIVPLPEPRGRLFIANGEFLVDELDNYWKIYLYDCTTIFITAFAFMPLDTMYVVATEHCFGIFDIVKYRLLTTAESTDRRDAIGANDSSYVRLIDAIRLHEEALKFASLLEETFSHMFLIFVGVSLIFCSTTSVLVLTAIDEPYNLARYVLLYGASAVQFFFYNWPGQRLKNYSSSLCEAAYFSDWYQSSPRSKRLLHFFVLRCSKPCLITGGGLYVLDFENFLAIMKTSFSFITVLGSFRQTDN